METPQSLDLFGKYKLRELIGQGSFAKVYYAKFVADGLGFAVKVMDKKSLDQTTVPRILREVSVMHRMNHPNIIRLLEVMVSKTQIYLVMEFASGGELFKVCRQGLMKESTARRYFQQLVSALHFCHSNGIPHRDLKSHNLLLGRDEGLRVSDFCLSALPKQLKDGMLQTACGTPGYTAPEVVSRRGYDGAKADACCPTPSINKREFFSTAHPLLVCNQPFRFCLSAKIKRFKKRQFESDSDGSHAVAQPFYK
ncbi:CBL-interacting serine/threonine-protein kinase 7-like [Aristolochia californica]|uniref:CBL-interacting serine/threonine-protein kinase 7-like n=1 Tax=Aristolochia californica TaxID=171875 RepID=UPI0035E064A0